MSKAARTLVNGARVTNGIPELGISTLRMLAQAIISGQYEREQMVAEPPPGI